MNKDAARDLEREALCGLLKELRTKAGIHQSELASRLKVPQSFVSKYESGERRLDLLEIRRVCSIIGIGFSRFVRLLETRLSKIKPL